MFAMRTMRTVAACWWFLCRLADDGRRKIVAGIAPMQNGFSDRPFALIPGFVLNPND